nr:pilus assembly protein [Pseudomonas sp.]
FALVAPVLFFLLFGIVGVCVLMLQDVLLESAVRRVTRDIQYQQAASGDNAAALIGKVQSGLRSRLDDKLDTIECEHLPLDSAAAGFRTGCAGAEAGALLRFTVSIKPTILFLDLPDSFSFQRVLAVRTRA